MESKRIDLPMKTTLMGYDCRTADGRLCTPWFSAEGDKDAEPGQIAWRYEAASVEYRYKMRIGEPDGINLVYGNAEQVAADVLRREFDKNGKGSPHGN